MQTPGRLFVPPERVELLRPAHGAKMADVNAAFRDSDFFQPGTIDFGKVEVRPALQAELRRDFRSHLVTALADAGADGGVEILLRVPKRSPMAAAARAAMPAAVPRQPACTAATAFRRSSTSRMGMQSAVFTATTAPGVSSSRASPSPSTPQRPPASTHVAEWICLSVARFANSRGTSACRVPKPCTSHSISSSSGTR